MRDSSNFLFLVLFLLPALFLSIGTWTVSASNNNRNMVPEVRPAGQGDDKSLYVVSEGARLELDCLLRGHFPDIAAAGNSRHHQQQQQQLEWMRGKARIMRGSPRYHFETKNDLHLLRQTMVIESVNKKVSSEYSCIFEDDRKRTIRVQVIDAVKWRTQTDAPGGPLDQPLTIDCGADNVPDQQIQIMNQHGRAIEEAQEGGEVVVAGPEVTIPRLGLQHRRMKIQCVAIRQLNPSDFGSYGPEFIQMDSRELIVDVWLPPKFAAQSAVRQAALGSQQEISWTVEESNPPVTLWTLKKNGEKFESLDAEQRKRIEIHGELKGEKPQFSIEFNEVKPRDFGHYTLVAYNGKLKSEQMVTMVEIEPPKQPRVSLEWVSSNGTVCWHIKDMGSQLSPDYYLITYKPLRRVPTPSSQQNASSTGASSAAWTTLPPINPNMTNFQNPYWVRRKINRRDDTYEIAGLDPYTEYEFVFTGGNDAGDGDPIAHRVITVDWERPAQERLEHRLKHSSMLASSGTTAAITSLLTTFTAMSLFLGTALVLVTF